MLLELVVLDEPHAARNDPPRPSAAAAAAPPPMNRRREVRDDASRAIIWGSIWFAMEVPFVVLGEWMSEKGFRLSGLGGSVEHFLQVLGGGNVGRREDQRRFWRPRNVDLVAGPQERQVLLGADVRDDRRSVGCVHR